MKSHLSSSPSAAGPYPQGSFERAHALYLWMGMQKTPKYAPNKYTLVALFGAAADRAHAKVVTKVGQRRSAPWAYTSHFSSTLACPVQRTTQINS